MFTSPVHLPQSRLIPSSISCLALIVVLVLMVGQAASSPGIANPGIHTLQQRAMDDWRTCRNAGGLFTLTWSDDGTETHSACHGGIHDGVTCRVSAVTSACSRPGGEVAAAMHISNPNGNPSP